jgi:calcineurin-like phosphoesterase family protein
MRNTWFCADLHLNHGNIVKYSKRPFRDALEMNEILISNWNNCVQQGDDVFYLGDFAHSNKNDALGWRRRLKGNIHFIEGNHDAAAFQMRETFQWYKQVHGITVSGQDIFLSHFAHRVWNRSHHGCWHLYGHSHAGLPDDPSSFSFDVGIDNTAIRLSRSALYGTGKLPDSGLNADDYRPINFGEVQEVMSTKRVRAIADNKSGEADSDAP